MQIFAGNWADADARNADSVLSITEFVICYANCPIVWCSKLQTEIALSTAEAEYIAPLQSGSWPYNWSYTPHCVM